MSSIKSRLSHARQKLLRRHSQVSSSASQHSSAGSERQRTGSSLRKSISMSRLPAAAPTDDGGDQQRLSQSEGMLGSAGSSRPETGSSTSNARLRSGASTPPSLPHDAHAACPALVLQEPTPVQAPVQASVQTPAEPVHPAHPARPARPDDRPSDPPARRQSLVAPSNARAITTLLASDPAAAASVTAQPVPVPAPIPAPVPASVPPSQPNANDDALALASANFNAGMLHRKIWVKRQNASATLVQIREDDLVDDVREMILRKYGNSLGRSFDAPDLTLRILPRDPGAKGQERVLGPEEDMCRTLDAYFPGGQTVHEALIIDIPRTRTPKPSPQVPRYYAHHDDSQQQQQTEYFPLMPIANPSPAALTAASHDTGRAPLAHAPHSIAVLQTGQIAPIPSPGGARRAHLSSRPKYGRHNTASPTTLTGGVPQSATSSRPQQRVRHDSSASDTKHSTASGNAPIPTPPAPAEIARQNSTPPTPRISSPKPGKKPVKKPRPVDAPSLPPGLLDNSVPPINVLIVEDNIINLRVLGAFMQRLKVRWQRAMNGKEAVEKWRAGGFHLVLMDIQLPIMDGLEATREIRRLERVNSIGVFSSGSSEAPNNRLGDKGIERDLKDDDKLGEKNLFKSPVIIVALTASSLQSDRHEALAAGCNDFLTKPVNFVWLERKVKEWGCMQALIDFDGWRRWKDFTNSDTTDGTSKLSTSYSSVAPRKGRTSASPVSAANAPNGQAGSSTVNGTTTKPKEEAEKKAKRKSMSVIPPPALVEEESATSTPDVDSGEN